MNITKTQYNMTQEDKQLLLKDLCARLPYKVVVDYGYNAFDVHNGYYIEHGSKCILKCYLLDVFMSPRQNEKGEYIKPYLRLMSSMTEEETNKFTSFDIYEDGVLSFPKALDYLNSIHVDYRGLIPKGLAIEAPEEMYNKKGE